MLLLVVVVAPAELPLVLNPDLSGRGSGTEKLGVFGSCLMRTVPIGSLWIIFTSVEFGDVEITSPLSSSVSSAILNCLQSSIFDASSLSSIILGLLTSLIDFVDVATELSSVVIKPRALICREFLKDFTDVKGNSRM